MTTTRTEEPGVVSYDSTICLGGSECDELQVGVYPERGPVGTAVVLCNTPDDRAFNTELLEMALEHTRANCNDCETTVHTRMVTCIMPLTQVDTDEAMLLHVLAQFEGIMTGAVDWAAEHGEPLIIDGIPIKDPQQRHLEVCQGIYS